MRTLHNSMCDFNHPHLQSSSQVYRAGQLDEELVGLTPDSCHLGSLRPLGPWKWSDDRGTIPIFDFIPFFPSINFSLLTLSCGAWVGWTNITDDAADDGWARTRRASAAFASSLRLRKARFIVDKLYSPKKIICFFVVIIFSTLFTLFSLSTPVRITSSSFFFF